MTVTDMSPADADKPTTLANETDVAQALREHAEVVARRQGKAATERPSALSPEAARDLLHELQVHQIELEVQNEELRRSQLELEASQARFFKLYDLAPVGYCSISEQGQILQANLAAAALLGETRVSLLKQPFSRFIFRADQDKWYVHRKLLTQTGRTQSLELRLAQPGSSPVWARVVASAADDASGEPLILVVLTDVSDLKLMEVAMRESEGRFRALVEWSPVAMLVHRDARVTYANAAALKLLGARTATELHEKPLLDLIDPASHPQVRAGLKVAAGQGQPGPWAELRCLMLDGTARDVEAQSIAATYDGAQVTITSLHAVPNRPDVDDGVA